MANERRQSTGAELKVAGLIFAAACVFIIKVPGGFWLENGSGVRSVMQAHSPNCFAFFLSADLAALTVSAVQLMLHATMVHLEDKWWARLEKLSVSCFLAAGMAAAWWSVLLR